jgi:hypothetical protein
MHQYVVNLSEIEFPKAPPPGRAEVFGAYAAQSADFLRRLRAAVAEKGLEHQVGGYGEAGGLPVFTLTCTPAVAGVIEALPGVTGVYADDVGSLGLIG